METSSYRVLARDGDTKDIEKQNINMIRLKNEIKTEAQFSSAHAIEGSTFKATIKFETFNESVLGLAANVNKCDLAELEIVNNVITDNPNQDDQLTTVIFEKIPKIETKIFGDDNSHPINNSPNEADDPCNNPSNNLSDTDSDFDPESDPFGDVDCDPSFSQTPQRQLINEGENHERSGASAQSAKIVKLPSAHTLRTKLNSKLQCGLCLEIQSSNIHLQSHAKMCVESHIDRRRFCVPCNKLFSSIQNYRKHALKIHAIKIAKERKSAWFKCKFCPRSFSLKESLISHHSASHPEDDFQTDKDRLKLKLYRCKECTSTFGNRRNLSHHMKSHKNERRYKCPAPNCEKAFNFNNVLTNHMLRFHSDDRQFKCKEPNCSKTFKTNDDLQIHLVCHSEERPFICSIPDCKKAFPSKNRLTSHLAAHRGARRYGHITDRPFKCEQCNSAFVKNWQLTYHLKLKHKGI